MNNINPASPKEFMEKDGDDLTIKFKNRLEQNPDDIGACFCLAQICIMTGKEDQGIEYAKKCISLLPQNDQPLPNHPQPIHFYRAIYHILAMALIKTDRCHEALDVINKGLEKLPGNIDLLHDLACVGYFLDDPDIIIEGGEAYLKQINDSHGNSTTRDHEPLVIVSTQDPWTILCVKFYLMTAYLSKRQFDLYEKMWAAGRYLMQHPPGLHKDLLSSIDHSGSLTYLEQAVDIIR
ncbi:MAG: tetratricopeptide repeat protein, partial [Desulfamplus sp.]|nr:tetratricopeptide repeat protein [Desulfamplus sp.]